MSKWLPSLLLAAIVPIASGQWTQAPSAPGVQPAGNYPQSQYPENSGNENASDSPDPADLQHGVARLSVVQGDVNIRRGDNAQLNGAVTNTPLLSRDHLLTSGGSRAEVQLDAGTILRFGPNTDINFADLQYRRAQLQLGIGTLIFRILPGAATQVEIDTPSIGIRALTQGEYRISVFDDGTSQITIRSGQLELSGPRGSERLDAGRSVSIRGDASDPQMQTTAEIGPDQFDGWSQDRDREFSAPQSSQYVSTDVQGAADLDQYGNWVPSGYGQVWRPRGVAADWSPYSDGQWSYVDYYGWSWIDYSPWGWAPYHYGRWFWNTGYGWCWWAGGRGHGAYWSPALVGFFGFGGRVGIGLGGLGWVALAPYERCPRWWGRAGYNGYNGYRSGAGILSYRNAGIRGGAITASVNGFGVPRQRFSAATQSQIQSASAFNGRIPVEASRNQFNYSARPPVENSRMAAAESRSFFHQGAQNRMVPVLPGALNRSSSPSANYRQNAPAAGAAMSGEGWKRFGTPPSTGGGNFHQNFSSAERSGWHHFGGPPQVSPRNSTSAFQPRPYAAPQQRMFTQPINRPQQQYSYPSAAPRQNYRAPANRQAQPRYSAPSAAPRGSGGGNGGARGSGGHHGR